jgi:hypothetical protein
MGDVLRGGGGAINFRLADSLNRLELLRLACFIVEKPGSGFPFSWE